MTQDVDVVVAEVAGKVGGDGCGWDLARQYSAGQEMTEYPREVTCSFICAPCAVGGLVYFWISS